jgi:phenylalanyl-tRNA synthetase alpha chain
METRTPPIRVVVTGRVFRHEEVDATHENNWHNFEGLLIDRDVSVAHMLHVVKGFLAAVFRREPEVRLLPAYFPFVEPGFQVDVRFRGRWMETLGCGLVHPQVLENGGVDSSRFSGFAFGMGIDRLVMVRHDVEDLRHFMGGDLRFLGQFRRAVGT